MRFTLRILLADENEWSRMALKQAIDNLPGLEVVGETNNGAELVRLAAELAPDLVLTDIHLVELDGICATRQLLQADPSLSVLAFSQLEGERLIYEMLAAGARGFLSKLVAPSKLMEAIKTVRETNQYYLGTKSMRLARYFAMCSYPCLPRNPVAFTKTELQIIRLLCQQLTTGEIARLLFLSPRTISCYRQAILEKTGSKNVIGIVRFAIRNHLFTEGPGESGEL